MKNISIDNGHLKVRGNAKGGGFTTFGLVFILCWIMTGFGYSTFLGVNIGLFCLVMGGICLIIGALSALFVPKKLYLEIKNEMMYVYSTGTMRQYYQIPLSRISYLTHIHRQKSRNTELFVLVLNKNSEPDALWVTDLDSENLTKNEIDLEYFPLANKKLPEFLKILEEIYGIQYKK